MRWFGLCASLFMATLTIPAIAANVSDGRFETGDYSDWSGGGFGIEAIASDTFGVAPIQGDYSAFLYTWDPRDHCWFTQPTDCAALFPPPLPSSPLDETTPVSHSFVSDPFMLGPTFIGQDLNARVGDRVSFDWNWLTNEGNPRIGTPSDQNQFAFADGAFIELTNGSTTVLSWLSNAGAPVLTPAASTGFDHMTGPLSTSLLIPSDGLWTLYIGMAQIVDFNVSSGLMIDNVRLNHSVPEPPTLALLAIVGVALGARRKRLRSRAQRETVRRPHPRRR